MKTGKIKIGDKVRIISDGGYMGLTIPFESTVNYQFETGAFGVDANISLDGKSKIQQLAFFDTEMELI